MVDRTQSWRQVVTALAQVPLGDNLRYVPLLVGNFHTENIWHHTESSSDVDSRG